MNQNERQRWLRILSNASATDLVTAVAEVLPGAFSTERQAINNDTPVAVLRPPEVGLAMVTGRVNATGTPFGLGEMTVTRCVVQIDSAMGVGYVGGRSFDHARGVAIADALLQGHRHQEIMDRVVTPLAEILHQRERTRVADIESSRVQFVTMVRGD